MFECILLFLFFHHATHNCAHTHTHICTHTRTHKHTQVFGVEWNPHQQEGIPLAFATFGKNHIKVLSTFSKNHINQNNASNRTTHQTEKCIIHNHASNRITPPRSARTTSGYLAHSARTTSIRTTHQTQSCIKQNHSATFGKNHIRVFNTAFV